MHTEVSNLDGSCLHHMHGKSVSTLRKQNDGKHFNPLRTVLDQLLNIGIRTFGKRVAFRINRLHIRKVPIIIYDLYILLLMSKEEKSNILI